MEALLSVSFGELFLKGANRKTFVNNALSHILKNIEAVSYTHLTLPTSDLV